MEVLRHTSIRLFCFRFVGWITNFIHNRDLANENMIRGYMASTISRSIQPERLQRSLDRDTAAGSKRQRGFLMTADSLLENRLSMPGSGAFDYKLHSRNHHTPLISEQHGLSAIIQSYCQQVGVDDHVMGERVLSITGGFSLNGKTWRRRQVAMFRLDTDAIATKLRVGFALQFFSVDIGGDEQIFVQLEEQSVDKWEGNTAVVHVVGRVTTPIVHVNNIEWMCARAKYWIEASQDRYWLAVKTVRTF